MQNKFNEEQGIFSDIGYHNHDNNQSLIRKYKFTEWCRAQSMSIKTSFHDVLQENFPSKILVKMICLFYVFPLHKARTRHAVKFKPANGHRNSHRLLAFLPSKVGITYMQKTWYNKHDRTFTASLW
jgi:hypothetical protein